jgi:YARHG domain-containing protein
MRKILLLIICATTIIMAPHPSRAQQLIESYQAVLSERDHFNSNGQRLTSAAAIIRQDRANFHRFGFRDAADEDDKFFADEGNRAALERLLEHGRADPGVISRIVNDTPFVRVEVWHGNAGPFIVVTLIEAQSPTDGSAEQQINELSCDQLWFTRNRIFKTAGYCFKTPRAISEFGNAGCLHDNENDVPLSQKDRNLIEAIHNAEHLRQCP